jgi:hypothetical protein
MSDRRPNYFSQGDMAVGSDSLTMYSDAFAQVGLEVELRDQDDNTVPDHPAILRLELVG